VHQDLGLFPSQRRIFTSLCKCADREGVGTVSTTQHGPELENYESAAMTKRAGGYSLAGGSKGARKEHERLI